MEGNQRLIQRPDLDEVHALVLDAVKNHYTVTLIGFCEVTYKGRAASVLGGGSGFLVIAGDDAPMDYSLLYPIREPTL